MIVFDLTCKQGHRFEGWFGSSGDYASQCERGLVACPECGSTQVVKAPMAPAVPTKSNARAQPIVQRGEDAPVANRPLPPEVQAAFSKLAEAQVKALEKSTWVGGAFAEQSREMHYGERDEAPIHGQASFEEAKSLLEEGVPIAPLPFPVTPPEKLN
jgi:hypothetical protein